MVTFEYLLMKRLHWTVTSPGVCVGIMDSAPDTWLDLLVQKPEAPNSKGVFKAVISFKKKINSFQT